MTGFREKVPGDVLETRLSLWAVAVFAWNSGRVRTPLFRVNSASAGRVSIASMPKREY